MTAKEYLKRAWNVDQRINSKLYQLDSLKDMATKATSTLGTEPVSGTRNVQRMADTIDNIVALENEINDDIDRLVDLKRDVIKTISKVQDTNCLTLLELRYLSFKSWDDIAAEMNYTSRWVHIMHSKALAAVEKILAERVH
ncbi:MAG: hypothetical protein J6N51_06175 [Selenomonas sp.]|nr:hypothetical protein [Selenomonas sp.]